MRVNSNSVPAAFGVLADGVMQLEVVDPRHAKVVVGGDVPAGKGLNLPSTCLDMTALTDKDRRDLEFAVAQGIDLVGLSFVGQARDVVEAQASGLPIVAKIERAQAVAHLEEIVAAADAVMVARGDLGVEIPIARVPIVQKQIIALANQKFDAQEVEIERLQAKLTELREEQTRQKKAFDDFLISLSAE